MNAIRPRLFSPTTTFWREWPRGRGTVTEVRFFTPQEAKAALPAVRPLVADLREAFTEYRFAREQVDELVRDHGEDPARVAGHPLQREAMTWRERASAADARVRVIISRINGLGADVKDPILGLVDFYAKREDGEVVLLCYRDDEDDLLYWHPIESGFAGRRPLEEL